MPNMINPHHVFSHQQQYPQDGSWMHQQQTHQQTHQQTQQAHHNLHQSSHAQSVAQQQLFGRMTATSSNGNGGHGVAMEHISGPASADAIWQDENRRVLGWVAELLSGSSRETALMELSKKREQVPELALVIWHSFGTQVAIDGCGRC